MRILQHQARRIMKLFCLMVTNKQFSVTARSKRPSGSGTKFPAQHAKPWILITEFNYFHSKFHNKVKQKESPPVTEMFKNDHNRLIHRPRFSRIEPSTLRQSACVVRRQTVNKRVHIRSQNELHNCFYDTRNKRKNTITWYRVTQNNYWYQLDTGFS
jgi:hypothetical protein